MGLLATGLFLCSLIGIIALFALKMWEERHMTTLAPAIRTRADLYAVKLKSQIMEASGRASHVWPFLMLLSRYLIHEGALGFARIAHIAAMQAHRLADFVSHKHHFERQTTRSTFLKQVGEQVLNDHRDTTSAQQSLAVPPTTSRTTRRIYKKKKT
jgi:hypothetical protein